MNYWYLNKPPLSIEYFSFEFVLKPQKLVGRDCGVSKVLFRCLDGVIYICLLVTTVCNVNVMALLADHFLDTCMLMAG